MGFIYRVFVSLQWGFLLLWLVISSSFLLFVLCFLLRLVLVGLVHRWGLASFHTYTLRIHSMVGLMYGPRCFLLCLIQLFKAPPLHVKLHAFSPFYSPSLLFISFICICIERLQQCFTSTHLWIKGWAELPELPTIIFLFECYLRNKPTSCPSNPNTRLTNAHPGKHVVFFVFYM